MGDSARWGEGYLSQFHLPFTMYDNLLTKYIYAHGRRAGLGAQPPTASKTATRKIAEEARNQYTLVYCTHEPVYRQQVSARLMCAWRRPGLEVNAKEGYYPSASDIR